MDNTQGAPHDGAVGDARKRHQAYDAFDAVRKYAEKAERERANKAEAERDEYKARYAELKNALTWDTTCLNCSNLMDKNYEQYVRLEKAEVEVAELRRRIEALERDLDLA